MKLPQRNDERSSSVPLNILVVDDSPTDMVLVDAHLRTSDRIDATVTGAATFEEAVRKAQNEAFDIVVCDLNLPDVAGEETVRQARGAFPSIPVLVLSGALDSDLERRLFKLGAQDCLSKNILALPSAGSLLARALLAARDRHELEYLREQTLQSLTNLVEASTAGKLVVRKGGEVALASQRAGELLGNHPQDMEGQPFRYAINVRQPYEIHRRGIDGVDRILTVESTPLSWLGEPAFLVTTRDTTDQSMREERLRFEATHDVLTGLPSRTAFLERLADLMLVAGPRDDALIVLLLDLEHLEAINRTFGHQVGDVVVQQMAGRLTALLPPRCAVGRPATDQFGVAIPASASADPLSVAAHALRSLSQPYLIGDDEVRCSVSVSVAWHDGECRDPRQLVERAESATEVADESVPTGLRIYDRGASAAHAAIPVLQSELRAAVHEGDLSVAYQPILDARSGNAVGLEALCRWEHPDHGMVPPSEFIRVAEDSGLIVPLGEWLVHDVCGQLVQWRKENPDWILPPVSINLTPRQLNDPNLVESMLRPLKEFGLVGAFLGVDINETALLSASAAVGRALASLAQEGIAVHLDDFGTGYSSLRHLRNHPISSLKIDRSFIQGLPDDPQSVQIVRAAIALGDALEKEVIAEGVETPEQLDCLRALGCNQVQGYLYARPAAPQHVTRWFTTKADAMVAASRGGGSGLATVTRITTQFEKKELEDQIERLRSTATL